MKLYLATFGRQRDIAREAQAVGFFFAQRRAPKLVKDIFKKQQKYYNFWMFQKFDLEISVIFCKIFSHFLKQFKKKDEKSNFRNTLSKIS